MSTCLFLARQSKRLVAILLFALLACAGRAAEAAQPATAKPAVTCATCHAGVVASYSHASMRHALESPGANPVLDTHPNLSVQEGKFAYTIQTKDGQSLYTVTDGTDSLTLPIRWMFGQHTQTWVLEKDGSYYESMVSYFPKVNALDTTPGDAQIKPANITEAMGRKLPIWETRECFSCHATNAVDGAKLTLDKLKPGLDCEHCHVGSELHLADAANDNFKTLPVPLKKMNSEQVSDFCGNCHRTWDTVVRSHWRGQAFVRFQPYRLENSRCFIGNDPRISCLACHNPHEEVKHDAAFYDSKCLACHGAAHTTATATPAKVCPVAKADCASCHMPKVDLPGAHARFTDHMIRVVHPGDPYPN